MVYIIASKAISIVAYCDSVSDKNHNPHYANRQNKFSCCWRSAYSKPFNLDTSVWCTYLTFAVNIHLIKNSYAFKVSMQLSSSNAFLFFEVYSSLLSCWDFHSLLITVMATYCFGIWLRNFPRVTLFVINSLRISNVLCYFRQQHFFIEMIMFF